MSDLPSRKATAEALGVLADTILIAPERPDEMMAYLVLVETAKGRASGRLVDREAIDRDALRHTFNLSVYSDSAIREDDEGWGKAVLDRLIAAMNGDPWADEWEKSTNE